MFCTVSEVEQLLKGLEVSKPVVLTRFSLRCKNILQPVLLHLLPNCSIFPFVLVEYLTSQSHHTIHLILETTGPFHSPVSCVNYWRGTYMILCMNIYLTVNYYLIHSGVFVLADQHLLPCYKWLRNSSVSLNVVKRSVLFSSIIEKPLTVIYPY